MVCLRFAAVPVFVGVLGAAVVSGAFPGVHKPVAAQGSNPALSGAWTLNAELSPSPAPPDGDEDERGRGGRGGGGRRGGGGGVGGGFGGGRGGPGGQRGGRGVDPEEIQRRRNAARDLFEAPERLTITITDSMVIVTTGDGRTTRLAPDGSKVKDESTGIERRTRWDAGKLVSDVSGVVGGRVTESYSVLPESGRLAVVVVMPGGDSRQNAGGPRPESRGPLRRVYDRVENSR